MPLTIVRISDEETGALYPSRLTLVRPDQFVAWRGDQWQVGILDLAAGRVAQHAAAKQHAAE